MDLDRMWGRVADQVAATAVLRGAVDRGEVTHAWLFAGPPAVGQAEAATALAAALNHPGDGPADVDGRGRMARGVHPNLVVSQPTGPEYLVARVREEWVPTASRSLTEGTTRVMRIVAADRMNEAAQNAFLKVLEEPPATTLWILEAEDTDALLDTIVSRCRRVEFRPWRPESLAAVARELGVPDERVTGLVRAAEGSPDRVRDVVARERAVAAARADAAEDLATAREKLARAEASTAKSRQRNVKAAQKAVAAAQRRTALPDRPGRAAVATLLDRGPRAVLEVATAVVEVAELAARDQEARNREETAALRDEHADDGGVPKALRQELDARHRRAVRDARRRSLDAALDDLGTWLRDVALLQAHGPRRAETEGCTGALGAALVHHDAFTALLADAGRAAPGAVVAVAPAIAACREALDRNGQPLLQFERLMLDVFDALR